MRADVASLYLQSAREVLEQEIGGDVTRGMVRIDRTDLQTDGLVIATAVTGGIEGVVLYQMSSDTAVALASEVMRRELAGLDEAATIRLADLGTAITRRAIQRIDSGGKRVEVAPSLLAFGPGARLATPGDARLAVPLHTRVGTIELQVVLQTR